jgi:hypothetical protein
MYTLLKVVQVSVEFEYVRFMEPSPEKLSLEPNEVLDEEDCRPGNVYKSALTKCWN